MAHPVELLVRLLGGGQRLVPEKVSGNWKGQKLRRFRREVESYRDGLTHQLPLTVKDHCSLALVCIRTFFNAVFLLPILGWL